MVARMRDVWPRIKETLPLEDEHRAAITAHMKRVPLFRTRFITGGAAGGAVAPSGSEPSRARPAARSAREASGRLNVE
jgi:hypothetical protein